jgi:hypothetical protein
METKHVSQNWKRRQFWWVIWYEKQAKSITLDYLVSVPCTCKDVNGTPGYFFDTLYSVQSGDIYIS